MVTPTIDTVYAPAIAVLRGMCTSIDKQEYIMYSWYKRWSIPMIIDRCLPPGGELDKDTLCNDIRSTNVQYTQPMGRLLV